MTIFRLARAVLTISMCFVSTGALAQSQVVAFTPGVVLTAAQLNQVQQGKVDTSGGTSTNQTLTTPSISGGTITGADASAAVSTATGGSFARTDAERHGTWLQPQDFLASGQTPAQLVSGQIDAEPAIAAAVAAAGAVILPCGTYLINEPFPTWSTDGIRLSGVSKSCVTLNINFVGVAASLNLFTLTGHYQTISELTLNAEKTWTQGSVIYSDLTSGDRFHDMEFTGPFWNGISIYGSNDTHIDHVYARPPYLSTATIPNPQNGSASAGGTFITLDGPNSSYQAVDTYLTDINIAQYTYGISYINASGIYASDIDIVGAYAAHIFDPAAGDSVSGVMLANVLGDTSYGPNWYFPASGGSVYDMMCTACWASSSYSDSGVVMANPNLSQINFSNSEALNNSKYGVLIIAGLNIGWHGGAIEMNNNKLGSPTVNASDVMISNSGGTIDWIRIQDAFIGQGGGIKYGSVGSNVQATYAVDLSGTPATAHIALTGLQTYNHSSGQFNLPGTTTNILTANNQGN